MKRYVKASRDDKIKEFVARVVLKNVDDAALNTVLRKILYNPNNKIDWNDAAEQILINMPETKRRAYEEIGEL